MELYMSASSSMDSIHGASIVGSSDTSGYASSSSSNADLSTDLHVHHDHLEDGHGVLFENTQPVVHALEYILCVREMCDVTFLVGKTKEPIEGLRAVMGARSRYFYNLFMTQQKKSCRKSDSVQKGILSVFRKSHNPVVPPPNQAIHSKGDHLVIVVPDYDHNVFRRVVSFVHFGRVTVTSDTVIGLICASTEYQLEDLRKACWDFVDRCLTLGSIDNLLKSGAKYRKRQHVKLFLKMISKIRQ